jgi:hypothetical protein
VHSAKATDPGLMFVAKKQNIFTKSSFSTKKMEDDSNE